MPQTKYIRINTRDEFYRVDISKIVYFEADGNYTNFMLSNQTKGTVLKNLSQVQDFLSESLREQASIFERVGRQYIVNLNFVYHIEVIRQKLTLSDGVSFEYKLSISKDALKKLKEKASIANLSHIADTEEHTLSPSEEETSGGPLGRLIVVSTLTPFQLKLGKNIIGRKATGSAAHVQIPCDNKLISREHLVIEVTNEPSKGLVHYVSLAKQQVNPTFVGKTKLEFGDKLVLSHNDIIHLPDIELRYEILDEEETELNTK